MDALQEIQFQTENEKKLYKAWQEETLARIELQKTVLQLQQQVAKIQSGKTKQQEKQYETDEDELIKEQT